MDFKSLNIYHDPTRIVQCLNEIIDTFDKIDDNYDVFKVETKADASYMVVAGLSDRSHMVPFESESSTVKVLFSISQLHPSISNSHLQCMIILIVKGKWTKKPIKIH